jgi:AsmA-like C-terminal region/AsmA family
MKRPQKILAALAVVLVMAAIALVQTFNVLAVRNRDQVQQELQKVLGKNVNFNSLEVHWLGQLGFVATEFRIADDPRFAATPLLHARELVLGISLWNLLFRRLVIDKLIFNGAEFQIITDETGALNLTTLLNRKNELRGFSKLPPVPAEPKHSAVSFLISDIRVRDGRIEYVDRSVKAPAELRMKNISMRLKGFARQQATQITFAASLTEGLNQDVRVDGRLEPVPSDPSWLHRPIDLNIRLDSLHVPVVARAIAALRDKIPEELDVTGPMALQAKAGGTAERPRIDSFTLKIPLFGSSDYNAVVDGSIQFTERRLWEDAAVQGKLVVEPLALMRLRPLKFFEQNLPTALLTDGTVGIYGRFEGTWENLRIGALVRADKAELRYKESLRKPADAPAEITTQITRQNKKLIFHPSQLAVGANRIGFSGAIDYASTPRLRLNLESAQSSLTGLSRLVSSPAYIALGGTAAWQIAIEKSLSPPDENWGVHGQLRITEAAFRQKASGARIENVNANLSFIGKQARFDQVTFRVGRSTLLLDGTMANLLEPAVTYKLRSADLYLDDLPLQTPSPPVQLANVNAQGVIQLQNERAVLTGSVASQQGSLFQFGFRDLRADVVLTAAGFTFKNLSAQVLNGRLRSDGYWAGGGEQPQQIEFTSQIEAIAMRALLAQLFPPLVGKFDGQLQGRAHFDAAPTDGIGVKEALKGTGEASVQQGVIKDFNLLSQLLLRGSGAGVSAEAASRLPSGFAGLIDRRDTSFDSLKATFTVEKKRVHTEDLVITTPDYTITGAGSVGFDRSTNWNGILLLSPRLTQEVQRDYRIIRYLSDRRGRLPISFRLDGKIPNVKIRIENRALAQALRAGSTARGDDKDAETKPGQEPKETKRWLPDALERFLNR